MASTEKEIDTEVALDLYKNKEVSLWRTAEIAGLCLEEFKELLASRSIKIEIGHG